ncbi:MAG: glycosyltransferase [Candidatus Neomarinimicrobiota bacterium]|jgi:glycosyltransferase involved in cell wall biosynthesis
MKILLLPSYYPNKFDPYSGIFFRDHALALKYVGHQVTVLAIVDISLKTVWRKRRAAFSFIINNDSGIITVLLEIPSIPKWKWLNQYLRTLIGMCIFNILCRKYGYPDIIHVHSFTAGGLARKIKQKNGIPYLITEHSTAFARNILTAYENKLALKVFQDADICTAVSTQLVKLLNELYRISFVYTPNPVDFSLLRPIIKHGGNKNLDRKRIRICNIAFFKENKRHDRLIHAFKTIVHDFPFLELHIAGDGPERSRIIGLVKGLGLESKVIFYGSVSRQSIFRILSSCDAFALSSDFETFGIVLVEAMSCGLPVVATKCGGPESIITDESLGILTGKDQESFTQGLFNLIKGVLTNQYDSKKISEHVRERYSYLRIGNLMTDLYVSILHLGIFQAEL